MTLAREKEAHDDEARGSAAMRTVLGPLYAVDSKHIHYCSVKAIYRTYVSVLIPIYASPFSFAGRLFYLR